MKGEQKNNPAKFSDHKSFNFLPILKIFDIFEKPLSRLLKNV